MNIQHVIARLLKTIEDKEQLLASLKDSGPLVDDFVTRHAHRVMCDVLEMNLKELNAILADCMAVREADIVADLERKDAWKAKHDL